jgi:hypothetical protein
VDHGLDQALQRLIDRIGAVVTTLGVLISLSARALRHLLARLVWPPPTDPARVRAWSLWRRRHQARPPCVLAASPATRPPHLNEVRLVDGLVAALTRQPSSRFEVRTIRS